MYEQQIAAFAQAMQNQMDANADRGGVCEQVR